jgi:hypothetical protein
MLTENELENVVAASESTDVVLKQDSAPLDAYAAATTTTTVSVEQGVADDETLPQAGEAVVVASTEAEEEKEEKEEEEVKLSVYESLVLDTSNQRPYDVIYIPSSGNFRACTLEHLKNLGMIDDSDLLVFIENPKHDALEYLQKTFGLSNMTQYAVAIDKSTRKFTPTNPTSIAIELEDEPVDPESVPENDKKSQSNKYNAFDASGATILHVLCKPHTFKTKMSKMPHSKLIMVPKPRQKNWISYVIAHLGNYFGHGVNQLFCGSAARVDRLWTGLSNRGPTLRKHSRSTEFEDASLQVLSEERPFTREESIRYLTNFTQFYSKQRTGVRCYATGLLLILQKLSMLNSSSAKKFISQCYAYFYPSYLLRTLTLASSAPAPAPTSTPVPASSEMSVDDPEQEEGSHKRKSSKPSGPQAKYVIDEFIPEGENADSVFRNPELSRVFFNHPEVIAFMASDEWNEAITRATAAYTNTRMLNQKFPIVQSDDYLVYDSITFIEKFQHHLAQDRRNRAKVQDRLIREEVGSNTRVNAKRRKVILKKIKQRKNFASGSHIAGINAPTPIKPAFANWLKENCFKRAIAERAEFETDQSKFPRSSLVKILSVFLGQKARSSGSNLNLNLLPELGRLLEIPIDEETGKFIEVSFFRINGYYKNLFEPKPQSENVAVAPPKKVKLSRTEKKKQLPQGKVPKHASLRNANSSSSSSRSTAQQSDAESKMVEDDEEPEAEVVVKTTRRKRKTAEPTVVVATAVEKKKRVRTPASANTSSVSETAKPRSGGGRRKKVVVVEEEEDGERDEEQVEEEEVVAPTKKSTRSKSRASSKNPPALIPVSSSSSSKRQTTKAKTEEAPVVVSKKRSRSVSRK